ncbi:Branched-chain amino acid transport system / permease component [Meiothermus luteus]|jgi:simple sugar transport system permease protein|uniref:Branched-chain amino acid transport system / permease component n=1 Tax=Meiothermus luteus TaxID=2026184 RepID=A0A399EH90_9DEIN|nr:ABC transporter permease [Meiothermus luteus]RIH84024.1 Branched-chain amino acid transport system / permease component [Meiothermus luteus]RMH53446.1 MAG: ABC transporter permease [Deinococcota bacterium]
MEEVLNALARALSFGTPLLIACLGALLNERAGVVNLGVEGMMALGALAGFAVAYGEGGNGNLWLAVPAAMLAGGLAALLHGFVTITLQANQFVSGLALSMVGLGVAGLLGKRYEGLPLFDHPPEGPFILGAIGLALLLAFLFSATRLGLALRSVGENPAAADLLGLNVLALRYGAVVAGGALAGLAGAYLSLVYRPSWTDGMTAGLGWIAVALVIFVGWNPLRAIFGAVFFGLLYYLQFRLQGQSGIPSEVFASLPYLLVILVLALSGLRGQQGNAPEALGKPYRRGER